MRTLRGAVARGSFPHASAKQVELVRRFFTPCVVVAGRHVLDERRELTPFALEPRPVPGLVLVVFTADELELLTELLARERRRGRRERRSDEPGPMRAVGRRRRG